MTGRGGGGDRTGNEMIFIIAGILAVLALLYYFFHQQIVGGLFWLKYQELRAIALMFPVYDSLIHWVQGVPTSEVTFKHLQYLSIDTGLPLRYPCAIILLALAGVIWVFHPDISFKGIESMQTLNKKMLNHFPSIQVVSELDLAKEPVDKGPWAMALTPIEFAKKHKLLYRDENQKVWVNKTQAKMLFVNQLGALWPGVGKLKPHERALFAALCLYANYKRDEGENLLEQMAASANQKNLATGAIDYKGVEDIIEQYANTPVVQAIVKAHAYKLCVFAALLAQGRLTGTIPNSLYLWIKPIDRSLWYTLSNAGRKAVFVEASAVHAHFLAEKEMGAPLSTPMVDSAVDALQEAVDIRIIRELE